MEEIDRVKSFNEFKFFENEFLKNILFLKMSKFRILRNFKSLIKEVKTQV